MFDDLNSFEDFKIFMDKSIVPVLQSSCEKLSAELILDSEEKEGYCISMKGEPLGIVKVLAQIVYQLSNESNIPCTVLLAMLMRTVQFYEQNPEANKVKDVSFAKNELSTLDDILNKGE